jgi:hypothetical protein
MNYVLPLGPQGDFSERVNDFLDLFKVEAIALPPASAAWRDADGGFPPIKSEAIRITVLHVFDIHQSSWAGLAGDVAAI